MSVLSAKSIQASRRLRLGALFLAALTFLTGLSLSRKTEYHQTQEDEGWLLEEQQVLSSTLKELEEEWDEALTEAALIEASAREEDWGRAAREIIGVRQVSYFTSNETAHEVIEFPLRDPALKKPALLRGEGDFVIPPARLFSAFGEGQWIENDALLYSLASHHDRAVVFTLRADEVLPIVKGAILEAFAELPLNIPKGGFRQVLTPKQSLLIKDGNEIRTEEAAEEAIRQFSRFGTWTIRYWPPRTKIVHYDPGILLGSSFLALTLALGGWWAAREQAQALRLAEERVSFVNAVSHELRTPLTNILLSTELVEDELTTPKSKDRIQLIKNESHRLSRMVENVLSFARSERKDEPPPPTSKAALAPFVSSCLTPFHIALARKKIDCELRIEPNASAFINEDLVSQILFNLLSNIQKYAQNGAQVWIHARVAIDCLFEVGNSSPVIPEKSRSRIFEPFERLDHDIDKGTTGTGLGLAISRDLARSLGGDLILVPSSSETIFRLTLPQ